MQKLVPIALALTFVACAKTQDTTPATASPTNSATDTAAAIATAPTGTESAVAPEVNPPGDIPDTQQFVKYTSSAGGYQLDVPEGWARKENGANVQFASKYDGVAVNIATATATAAPTAASARADQAKAIAAQGHATTITDVTDVSLPAGKAVLIKFASNSDPNAVTNKQVRLENEAYLFFTNGKIATLTLWAPQGADNVDQWKRMSKSFRWR
ncbi:MAG: hypothetical protein M3Z17_10920 [Gemmatimonadota bacterium]|nr:hypothetical protein [Gemmatimonadota bacterium]